jgi:uncharacterized membrane-anchored protein YhcB (DUF1043 family)
MLRKKQSLRKDMMKRNKMSFKVLEENRRKIYHHSTKKPTILQKITPEYEEYNKHLIEEPSLSEMDASEEVNLSKLKQEVDILTKFIRTEFGSTKQSYQQPRHKNNLKHPSKYKPSYIIYCCRTHSQISQIFTELK